MADSKDIEFGKVYKSIKNEKFIVVPLEDRVLDGVIIDKDYILVCVFQDLDYYVIKKCCFLASFAPK